MLRFLLPIGCLCIILLTTVSGIMLIQAGGLDTAGLFYLSLLAVILLETAVIAGLVFGYIPSMRRLFQRSRFFDAANQLPNMLSLRRQIGLANDRGVNFALTYIWIAGLENIELARGATFRDKYLKVLSEHLQVQLENSSFRLKLSNFPNDDIYIFYCGNNTLGVLTQTLSARGQERLQILLDYALGSFGHTYGYNLDVRLVLGSANASGKLDEIDDLLQQVGVTLAQCIQSKQLVMLYSEEVGRQELRQITLLSEFEQALLAGQFYLEWQPQISTVNNELVGLEALVRWRHPQYGVVAPDQFIPLLEQSSKITSLSLWVMQQVLNKAPEFFARFPGLDVSVNLSVYDLMNSRLLPAIDEMLQHSGPEIARQVVLEITESMHMEDNAAVLISVQKLQQRGFRVSVDDFGAGYASFGYLQSLPVNELKIDRRYTQSIEEPVSQAIIQSIIGLARRLNVSLVGEGVESQRQQELLASWGVQRVQGWGLGKPASDKQILQLSAPELSVPNPKHAQALELVVS